MLAEAEASFRGRREIGRVELARFNSLGITSHAAGKAVMMVARALCIGIVSQDWRAGGVSSLLDECIYSF
jgi:hypothetical protein